MKNAKARDGKAIGRRVKMARLLAGCTRKEFEIAFGISVNTLVSWEVGRSALTLKGAKRLLYALNEKGLQCSIEWLLTGEGLSPYPFNEIESFLSASNILEPDLALNNHQILNEEDIINKEMALFTLLNINAVVFCVIDDAMEPEFLRGSYVGGKRRFGNKLTEILGLICIVEVEPNYFLLRKVVAGNRPGAVNLCATNPHTQIEFPVLYNQIIISAAPVIWYRCKEAVNEMLDSKSILL